MTMALLSQSPTFEPERDLLVFIHIPKCGGTSVHRFLNQAMRGGYVNVHQKLLAEGLEAHRDRFARAKGIGGHFGIDENPALPLYPERQRRYFSVVRDPVARFISHFRYFTRSPKSELLAGHPELASLNLSGFIDFLRKRKDASPINVQTRMLTARPAFDEAARAILRERYIGLVPTEDLFVFFRLFPNFVRSPLRPSETIRENVSPSVDGLEIDEDSLAYIYDVSREDLRLYNFVREWFAEGLADRAREAGEPEPRMQLRTPEERPNEPRFGKHSGGDRVSNTENVDP